MTPTRRSFITATAALFCAPAIVRASSLMPVRAPKLASVAPRKLLAPIPEAFIGIDGFVYQPIMDTTAPRGPAVQQALDKWARANWEWGMTVPGLGLLS